MDSTGRMGNEEMAERLEDFSLDALERRNWYEYITDYNRADYSYGCTLVSFKTKFRVTAHLLGAVASLGTLLPWTLYLSGLEECTYFHTEDGIYLGSTSNEAIDRANEIGENKMRQKEYGKARSYFNIAYNLCSHSQENVFRKKRDNAETEMMKVRKEERDTAEIERVRKEKEKDAKNFYEQGLLLWNEAFSLESSDQDIEAKAKFQMSKHMFLRAAELMQNTNLLYNNWLQVSILKIEGDTLFNDGMTLLEEGRRLSETQKYEEALTKYREANTKFAEGLSRSGDLRFQACIDIVTEIERITLGEKMQALLAVMEVRDSTSRQSSSDTHLQANIASHSVIDL